MWCPMRQMTARLQRPTPNNSSLLTPQNLCDHLKAKLNAEGGWNIISAEPTGSYSDQDNWVFHRQRRYLCRFTRARELKLGPLEVAIRPGNLDRKTFFEAPKTNGPLTCLTCDQVAKSERPRCLAKVVRGLIVSRPLDPNGSEQKSVELNTSIPIELKRHLARQVCHYVLYSQDIDQTIDTEYDLPAYTDLFAVTKTPCN